jgi:hypothetical protein
LRAAPHEAIVRASFSFFERGLVMKFFVFGFVALACFPGCGGSTSDDSKTGGAGGTGGHATGGAGAIGSGGNGAGGAGGAVGGAGGSATGGSGGAATGGTGGGDPFQKFLGTWLIGWTGDLNHFSWLRLEQGGTARFLDGVALSYNYPYWDCNGVGSWSITEKIDTVGLNFPTTCTQGFEPLTFTTLAPTTGGYPKGAVDTASIETTTNPAIEGYRFPESQCNVDLTSCADPFK